MESIEDSYFLQLVKFYLWTGCRRTEATDLTWLDIDWENSFFYLGPPDSKTKLRRSFPITDRLGVLLKELYRDRNESDRV